VNLLKFQNLPYTINRQLEAHPMAHFLAKSLFAISFVAANVALNTVEAVAEEPALWAEVDGCENAGVTIPQ
jgi:hypothetical protein